MRDAAEFWDKAAEKYARSPIADLDAYGKTMDRTASYLKPTDSVLEVGCGTGSTALRLASKASHITATDLSVNMVRIGMEKARAQGVTNVDFVAGGLDDSALGDGTYDAVLAFNLLHLVPDPQAAIAHLAGRVKPGGLFISKTICRATGRTPLRFRVIKTLLPLLQLIGKAPYVNFMHIDELEGIVTAAGFRIIETGNYPAAPPSRFIVARKD